MVSLALTLPLTIESKMTKSRWWKGGFWHSGSDAEWRWTSLRGDSYWEESLRGRWPRRRWVVVRQFVLLVDGRRWLVEGDWFGRSAPTAPEGGLEVISEVEFRAAEHELEARRRRGQVGIASGGQGGALRRAGNGYATEVQFGGLDSVLYPKLGQGSHVWDGKPVAPSGKPVTKHLAEYDDEAESRRARDGSPEQIVDGLIQDL